MHKIERYIYTFRINKIAQNKQSRRGYMELRKLIGFGKATFSITLPKKWVKENALVKGDLILIQEKSPEKLEISPKLTEQPELIKEATLNMNEKNLKELERELITAYINDY